MVITSFGFSLPRSFVESKKAAHILQSVHGELAEEYAFFLSHFFR